MKTPHFRIAISGIVVCAIISIVSVACRKENSQEGGNGAPVANSARINVFLTDHQSLIFDKVFIDIQKVEVKVEDDGVDSLGGWFSLDIRPGIYDVLRLRNGLDTLLAAGTIPMNRKLQKVRITLGNNNSVEKDGKNFPLVLKDNKNSIIVKLEDINVEFTSPDQVRFWIDFDAGLSIREHHGNFELEPQLKAFCKKNSGRIEGRVVPTEAQAIVLAINGSDTTSAKPEHEGEFKIVGLKAGTYQLLIDATANNYRDTTISNIVVRNDEDTKTGTITLKK